MAEEKSTRDGFGAGLLEAGRDKRVVALTTDLCESTRVNLFSEAYPERFFDMGVAEQNAICVAAGFAASGKIPFVSGFAVFIAGRGYDQIRLHAGISGLNIKLVGAHGGLLTGRQGASHQMLEDIGMMRAIPGMTVVSPADYEEARQATIAAAKHNGPVYLRLGREKIPVIHGQHYRFQLGKGNVMRQGKDVTIIATGPMVNEALEAHKLLSKLGIYARVINIHTIKPLDKALIIQAAKETKGILTAEDHNIMGGLGSAVAEVLSEQCPTRLVRIGVNDRFGNSGKPFELYEEYGLTAKHIADAALRLSK
jgi:transketolase